MPEELKLLLSFVPVLGFKVWVLVMFYYIWLDFDEEIEVTPVNNIDISDSILWVFYLLPEIIITPFCCLIIISVHVNF